MSEVKEEITIVGFVIRETGNKVNETLSKYNLFCTFKLRSGSHSDWWTERRLAEITRRLITKIYLTRIWSLILKDLKMILICHELNVQRSSKNICQRRFENCKQHFYDGNVLLPWFLVLKWLIFICKYDAHDKITKVLLKLSQNIVAFQKRILLSWLKKKVFGESNQAVFNPLHIKLLDYRRIHQWNMPGNLKQMIKEESKWNP